MADQFLNWMKNPVHVSTLAMRLTGLGALWNILVHGQRTRGKSTTGDGAESGGWFGDGDGDGCELQPTRRLARSRSRGLSPSQTNNRRIPRHGRP